MKKVLLTGATGFIGRHCLPMLVAKGYEVHAVSTEPPANRKSGAQWHRADLLDSGAVFELMDEVQPDALLHLAWYAVPGKYWTSTENFRWVRASLELFQSFQERGGKRAVVAGSCAEYDWRGDGYCDEGRTPLRPSTLYGSCKHATHVMLEAYAKQTGMSAAWGRIFFLYGTHEYPNRLVASVIRSLLQDEAARCSHGEQVRDFLFVEDVAAAFVALLESEVEGAVNIASGRPVTLKEVIEEIGRKLGRASLIRLGALEAAAGEPMTLVADARRLRDEVGWTPQYNLSEGLDQTIRWWEQQLDNSTQAVSLRS